MVFGVVLQLLKWALRVVRPTEQSVLMRVWHNEVVVAQPDSELCRWCGMDRIPWLEGWLCAVCDNRDDGESTWFEAFTEYEAGRE